eukprot:TRINITY_DN5147_c0_g1_i3.p1 TRINITY_DN5147_c0_g1~~TRINITY_DN5147_c0_g1_i3.p1  ORF type:complete len:322 (+),score=51.34 TRINITY_DN5147_c0_g1_i3:145-1110(+)
MRRDGYDYDEIQLESQSMLPPDSTLNSSDTAIDVNNIDDGKPKRRSVAFAEDPVVFLDEREPQHKPCLTRQWCNKANILTTISLACFITGSIIRAQFTADNFANPGLLAFSKYLLSIGLFAFICGISNSIAVKLFFDKVPCIYGSGVVQTHQMELRDAMRRVVMNSCLDSRSLQQHFMSEEQRTRFGDTFSPQHITEALRSTQMELSIDNCIRQIVSESDGPVALQQSKALVVSVIMNMAPEIANLLTQASMTVPPDSARLRTSLDALVSDKLAEVQPDILRGMINTAFRQHASWVVVWGNIVGAMVGLVAQAAGYGSLAA